ncbi:P27 family phage terminase small subunit [Hansschlegelia zhihuaiae]|uniref:P27 family phage terminase small subunit n=1 Tax=Hansschlegelia zhihuaiae TaxID=405005 RepID=A0A4Q0M808_9HYPH|nr:P27 family phage terminase small subunit [Hansschlegelia zhihuaiae]RXF69241.1 P27 family phage terminase small subunit [Hansschlegelia zhihuaiae]
MPSASRSRAGPKAAPRPAKDALTRAPKAPAHLTAEGRAEWRRVAPHVVASGAFAPVHLPLLEVYCVHLGRVRELERQIQATAAAGGDVARLMRLQDGASKTALRYAAELYASPAAGSRFIASGAHDNADLAAMGI